MASIQRRNGEEIKDGQVDTEEGEEHQQTWPPRGRFATGSLKDSQGATQIANRQFASEQFL